ncbi:CynX/NimT family MFS transporter [Paraburkholderia caribensis]|uniref:MFS transporter n=1 Tax=Paraburkholderia caribensis TaxID=75105 RepID=UPI001F40CE99
MSIGPVLPSIQSEFGLSHAVASLLTAIPDLLMGLLALPAPWLARRYGRNGVLLCALVVLCVATVARAFSPNTVALLATTAGVGGGIAIAGALFGGLIKAKFPTRAAMLMGIYATALSFGSTVAAGTTGLLASIAPGGWRGAAGVWGILGAVSIVGWYIVANSERTNVQGAASAAASAPRLPIRDGKAWLVALFFACDNFLFYALLSWIAPMYHEFGLPVEKAGLILASFTAAFMCANPIIGALSKNHDRRAWLGVSAGLVVVGLVGFAATPTHVPVLWVGLAAVGLGGGFTLGMTLPLDNTHSADEANSWNAFAMLVGYLIAATGPFAVGLLRDWTGGFQVSSACLVVVGAMMVAIVPFLKPRSQVSQI